MKEHNKLVSPSGEKLHSEQSVIPTERTIEREHEETEYTSVIIKRWDEAVRHPDDTLEKAIEEGLQQLQRPALSLFLSSIAAGLIVGFSAMAVGVVTTVLAPLEQPLVTRVATAIVYPLGFVICIMSGAQLFTEHTAPAVYPVLERREKLTVLLRLWGIIIVGNLIGAATIGGLLNATDDVIAASKGYVIIGHHLTEFSTKTLFLSAILAGWLMALGAWLVQATPPGSSQQKHIYIVTFLIGLGGLHHSIAGSAEMFTAMFVSDEFAVSQAARFITVALLGNLCGGGVFVAVLNYAHIRKTQPGHESAIDRQQ